MNSTSVDDYARLQHEESSWSHDSVWGQNAINNAALFQSYLLRHGLLAEDDVFCDFGGNDGTVAAQWQVWNTARGWPNTVAIALDMDGIKQAKGRGLYPNVTFVTTRMEDLSTIDPRADWGFCSHTLEHVQDLPAAMRGIAAAVRNGLYVVVPVETDAFRLQYNPAHMRASESIETWKGWLATPGLDLHLWGKPMGKEEFHLLYTKAPWA